jgi:hypothetical protein
VEAKAKKMHQEMVRKAAIHVQAELLSGTTSTRELTNAGHPFARKKLSRRGYRRTRDGFAKGARMSEKMRLGAGASFPLLPINKQTGRLAKSARIRAVTPPPGGQSWQLGYTAPYAPFILGPRGTRKMVGRGFQRAKKKIDTRLNKQLGHDIRLMTLRAAVTGRV